MLVPPSTYSGSVRVPMTFRSHTKKVSIHFIDLVKKSHDKHTQKKKPSTQLYDTPNHKQQQKTLPSISSPPNERVQLSTETAQQCIA